MGQQTTPIQARTVITGDTAPNNTSVLWRDSTTNPPTLRQYDGTEWVPVAANPIAKTDSAVSFTESDVSGFTTNATLSNGSYYPTGSNEQTRHRWGTADTSTGGSGGIRFTPNQPLAGITVHIQAFSADNTRVDKVELRDSSGSVLASTTGANHQTWNTIEYPLEAGTEYQAYCPGTGAEMSGTPSGSGNYLTVNGWTNSYEDRGVDGISGRTLNSNTHAVSVEWANPSDVYAWDSATFTRHGPADPEVYLDENQSGTWTEIAGPISRGADIPAVAGNNVRLRAVFTGPGFLDSAHRRYQV